MAVDVSPPLSLPFPTPLHEDQRLQALKRWQAGWGDPEQERAQALVNACAQALGAPVAALGWLDEQSWSPMACAQCGPQLAASPKTHTPCAYAALQCDAPWQVHDLTEDPRWSQSSWLQSYGWQSYAGMAVRDERGWPLATLVVFDSRPRNWQPSALLQLQHLATAATAIMEAGALRHELSQHRITDALTGLNNRPFFIQTLEIELSHAMRTGEPFTVLNMDLDGFKAVKDGFGHTAGEAVLREVSERLLRSVRQGDVVARFGGDEFGVIMRHGGKESAQVLAKRIVKSVSEAITLPSGDEIGVGISIGMAAYTDNVVNVQTLLQRADQALYQAKQQNEKRWKMFVGIR
ncbi:MAG: hypothetical protein RI907_1856 [Pseudomonadota bacterium]|jgi:diguanylate cyclase (GGDEF)-like protein